MHFSKRLFNLTIPIRTILLLTILFGLLSAAATIGQAFYLSEIIDGVFLKYLSLNDVHNTLIFLLLFGIAKSIFHWIEQNFANKISSTIKIKLREKISDHIFNLGPNFTKSERSGEISNTLVNGVEKLDAYFSQFLPQLFFSSLIPLLILIFVIQIDLLSTIVFIVTAPLIPIFMVLIGVAADKLSKKQWKQLSLMSAYFLDIIQGMYTIKIFGRSKDILEKLKIINISFKKSSMKVLRVAFVSALVLEVLSTISIAIIAVEIGLRLLNGTMEFQPALFILILAPEFYNPLRQLGARYHAGLEGVAAAERIFTILDAPIDEKKIERKVNLANNINYHSSAITFQGVSYTYKGKNKTAVENLTFRIEPNNTTALIGETGSGKTTTTNLLLKFISPQSGEIKIGGTDLASLKRDEWLNRISLITQSPHLFHLSIKDNLQMAKENATENELIESLKFAKIYDLIKKLPTGINTIVGERGTRFSGGETQRIAIARAYLKDAPILIMDEPTANLDPKIESDLIKNIFEFSRHKTVLIIAHRLNTIMNANKILLYRNGKIVGNGSYDELLKSSKYFTELLSKYKGAT